MSSLPPHRGAIITAPLDNKDEESLEAVRSGAPPRIVCNSRRISTSSSSAVTQPELTAGVASWNDRSVLLTAASNMAADPSFKVLPPQGGGLIVDSFCSPTTRPSGGGLAGPNSPRTKFTLLTW